MADPPYDMHLILNTHWDREWRWSFRETQIRLVQAMDLVLDHLNDPRFQSFLTDAQMSMIDDYLELRPERRDELVGRVQEGRLQAGPWYTLPAEFLVSGESLVRNLLLGHRLAHEVGGVMKVAYYIFSWGQVSQLPQIYRQFGMHTICFYRGVDQSALDRLEFWWEAPDGEKSLAVTFGAQHRINFWVQVYRRYIMDGVGDGCDRKAGKGFFVNLSDPYSRDRNHWLLDQCKASPDDKLGGWMEELVGTVRDKASTPHLVFFQGFDLENPDILTCDLVDKINEQIDFGTLTISSLPTYMKVMRDALEASGVIEDLPTLKGEMLAEERQDGRFGQLYPGVFSARMTVKLANAASELRLEKWAEPAAAWATMRGADYPLQQVRVAWKELLKNQQHDGIGGCHVDRVTETMFERNRDVDDLSEAVTRNALQQVVAGIDCRHLAESEVGLVVFNASSRVRDGVFEAIVDVPTSYIGDDPVYGAAGTAIPPKGMVIEAADGTRVPCQILDQWEETVFAYRKYAAQFGARCRRFRVLVDGGAVPRMGYTCLTARHKDEVDRPPATLSPAANTMENEFLRIVIAGDGTFTLHNKETGHTHGPLHFFEDGGERSNPLSHIAPAGDAVYTTLGQPADVARIYAGPLGAKYRIELRWRLPAELEIEPKVYPQMNGEWVEAGRPRRSRETRELVLCTEVELRRGSRSVHCRTVVHNTIRDHRLRLMLETATQPDVSTADSPFDVVQRPVQVPDATGWDEDAVRGWPSSSFVDVGDAANGLAYIHKGTPEYEAMDNGQGTLAITFLKCLRATGGGGETYCPQELSQCQGEQVFSYALFSHAGDFRAGGVCAEVDRFRSPVRVAQTTRHPGAEPFGSFSFLDLDCDDVVVTCLKRAEDEDGFILRGYNPSGRSLVVPVTSGVPLARVERVQLEELPGESLPLTEHRSFSVEVTPGQIFSVRLVPAE